MWSWISLRQPFCSAVALVLVGSMALGLSVGRGQAASTVQLAESSSAGDRVDTAGIDPALEARLDQAAATYKQLASADVDSLVANARKLLAALQANDVAAARQAWVDARVAYERSEIFTIEFPFLDAAIDAWPSSESGFHAIEAKLFTPGAALPIGEAQVLVGKVETLQHVFGAQPLYAHGVLVGIGALALELGESKVKGGESAISGTSLTDMQSNVQGMEVAWNTVFAAIMQEKNKGVADRVEKEIAEVKQLVSVASLDQVDAPALESKTEMLAGSLSDAAVELGWKAPDFTETDD
jgi:iron uptake system component EfeO